MNDANGGDSERLGLAEEPVPLLAPAASISTENGDLPQLERTSDGMTAADFSPVERRTPGVEHDALGPEQREADHGEIGIPTNELRVGRLNAGEIELAGCQRGQLGGGLVHDDHDEPIEPGRASECRGKVGVGLEDPASVMLVRHEPEGAVPDRHGVPGGLP